MKRINHIDPIDFLTYIIRQIDRESLDNSNNYSHTHDRIHYNPNSGHISFEEVCVNEYGSCYGRGVYGDAYIPVEWNEFLPEALTNSPYWMDL